MVEGVVYFAIFEFVRWQKRKKVGLFQSFFHPSMSIFPRIPTFPNCCMQQLHELSDCTKSRDRLSNLMARRPQSAKPARRASALSCDDADDDPLTRSAPIRDVRLNLEDNESFYKSPQRTRGREQRPISAPPERACLPGTVLSSKPRVQPPGTV